MKRTTLIALSALLSFSCTNEIKDQANAEFQKTREEEKVLTSKVTGEQFSAVNVNLGRLVVKFSEEYTALIEGCNADVKALSADTRSADNPMSLVSGKSLQRVFPYDEKYEGRTRREGMHRWYYVDLNDSQDFLDAEELLVNCSEVELVELDRKILRIGTDDVVVAESYPPVRRSVDAPFNDPRLGEQWHYYNDGSLNSSVAGADINVYPAWRNYPAGGCKVVVGVVDGLVDTTHEDLIDNLWSDEDGSHGKSFVNGAQGLADKHGTHVAGTVAAVNNNGIGVCGVAGGDKARGIAGAKIMTCGIFEGNASGDGAQAIKWSCDHGANISQNSWGYQPDTNGDGIISAMELAVFKAMKIPATIKDAIDYFNKYAGCDDDGNQLPDSPMKGGVVIFAAGNDNIDFDPICYYGDVVSVAAIGADFQQAYYSNYGSWVDICATGGDARKDNWILSTLPGNSYGYMQGTSMACPHVSGIAALIASTYQGQGFTREDLIQLLLGSTDKSLYNYNSGLENKLGKGLADAAAGLSFTSETPAPVNNFKVELNSNRAVVSWDVPADKLVFGYRLYVSKSSLSELDPANPGKDVDVIVIDGVDCDPGYRKTFTIDKLIFEQDYHFRIVAINYKGLASELSREITATTSANIPPSIEAIDGTMFRIKPFESPELHFKVSDPDGHPLQITLTPNNLATSMDISGETVTISIIGTKLVQGHTYNYRLKASDGYADAVLDFSVEVLLNNEPELIKPLENVVMGDLSSSIEIDLSEYFKDEDGEQLGYTLSKSGNTTIHRYTIEGNKLTLKSFAFGTSTLTLKATDACGKSVSSTFKMLVRDGTYPVDLYPNPVVDVLNIRTPEDVKTKVLISNRAGATVFVDTEAEISPFEPLSIDMSKLPSGVYYVELGNQEKSFSVIKK